MQQTGTPTTTTTDETATSPRTRRPTWRPTPITVVFVVGVVVIAATNDSFREVPNLLNVLQQASIIGIIALGQTLVLIGGGFDLSVGATAAMSGLVAFLVFSETDSVLVMIAGCAVGIAVGALIGALNGFLVGPARLNPLIATLGTMSLVRGLVLVLSEGQLVYASGSVADDFTQLAFGTVLGVPVLVWIFAAFAVVTALWVRLSLTGHHVFAVGGNVRAARVSGLRVRTVKAVTYVISGAFAAVAGLLLASQTASALPNSGVNYELQSITAAVIGGTALTGGKGSVGGTVIGVLILAVISNALNLYGVSAFWQQAVTGAILLVAVTLSALSLRKDAVLS